MADAPTTPRRIAVAGGTGLIGRMVVQALRDAGDQPVVMARSHGVDLTDGVGVTEALTGVDAVIDVVNVAALRAQQSIEFFEATTSRLLGAARDAGVGHVVTLSIVGVDRVDLGYYQGKRRQEELVLAGPVPATVLRATQFHEFAAQLLQRGRGPVVPVPTMLCQPVAAAEVADELVRLAHGDPLGMAPEMAGPDQHRMPTMVRRLLRARGSRRLVVPLRLPGAVGRQMAGGGLLPISSGPRGRQTYDQWLATQDEIQDRRRT